MQSQLKDLQSMLVYIFEYIVEGKKHSVVLKPIDAANGIVLDDVPGQPGIVRGLTVSGGTVHIPIEGITNHFQSWWKVFRDDGRGGVRGEYTDDEERVGRAASEDVGKKGRWDEETGEYTRAREVERPPEDAKRIYHKDKRPEQYRD